MTAVARRLLQESLETRSALVVLALVGWVVYHPAFNRVFVWDQLWYFAELGGRTRLVDGLHHIDYAVTRIYWKGDDALLRPFVFTWLAINNALFSYHHEWWNAATAALHVCVAVALFRLLIAIRPSPFALPIAVLFLVLKPSIELVLWHHVGGYLLACLFVAIGLRAFVLMTQDEGAGARPSALAVYTLAMTGAALCYESMALASLVAGLLLVWKHPRVPRIAMVFFPIVLFALLYMIHIRAVQRPWYVDRPDTPSIMQWANVLQVVPRSLYVLVRWTFELMVPSAVTLHISAFQRFGKTLSFSWTSPLHVANMVLALGVIALIGMCLSGKHLERRAPLLIFLAGALLTFAAVLCAGRPPQELLGVTYYVYFVGFWLVILLYALVDFDRLRGWMSGAAWILVAGLLILNTAETVGTVRASEQANRLQSQWITRAIQFVDTHKYEPDFSIGFEPALESVDPVIELREGYPDQPNPIVRNRRVTAILFAKYVREQPKYTIDAAGASVNRPIGD